MNAKLNNSISKLISETDNATDKSRMKKFKKYVHIYSKEMEDISENDLNNYRQYLEYRGYSQQTVSNDICIARKIIRQLIESGSKTNRTSKKRSYSKDELQRNYMYDLYHQNLKALQQVKASLDSYGQVASVI